MGKPVLFDCTPFIASYRLSAMRREFLVDELVKSIDALSREQFRALVASLGLQHLQVC